MTHSGDPGAEDGTGAGTILSGMIHGIRSDPGDLGDRIIPDGILTARGRGIPTDRYIPVITSLSKHVLQALQAEVT